MVIIGMQVIAVFADAIDPTLPVAVFRCIRSFAAKSLTGFWPEGVKIVNKNCIVEQHKLIKEYIGST